MPQLHLYVSEPIAEAIRRRAESRGISVSGLLAEIVEREAAPEWPAGYFERVTGAWLGDLERPPQGDFEVRQRL
jgi:hypothetical protein